MATTVDECGAGVLSRAEFEITDKEVDDERELVDRERLEELEDDDRLDDWISIKEEVVQAVQSAYHVSFRLLQGGHFEDEPVLGQLRRLLIEQMAELKVAQRWVQ